jgi:hypothetical protein
MLVNPMKPKRKSQKEKKCPRIPWPLKIKINVRVNKNGHEKLGKAGTLQEY